MYTQEYNENHIDNAAEYCEMCGAQLVDGCPDVPNASLGAEAINAIAHMYVADPLAVRILLRKISQPGESSARIATAEKCSKATVLNRLSALRENYPDLSSVLGFKSTASRGQSKQHKRGMSSHYVGVTWRKDRSSWKAQVVVAGRTISLGSYRNEDDAARAYNAGALKHIGSNATLNDI